MKKTKLYIIIFNYKIISQVGQGWTNLAENVLLSKWGKMSKTYKKIPSDNRDVGGTLMFWIELKKQLA